MQGTVHNKTCHLTLLNESVSPLLSGCSRVEEMSTVQCLVKDEDISVPAIS